MEEIFELQRKLNDYTLKNIGLDFDSVLADPEEKALWIENYRKALSAELAELVREVEEFGAGTQNGRIEIVDMLHFLVSLSQIVDVLPSDISMQCSDEGSFIDCSVQTFLALDDLQNSLKWKWWAKGGGFKPDKARGAVLSLWRCLLWMCALFQMDFATLKKIYVAKNKLNFARQDQDYNEDTKTDADNRALKVH